MFTFRPLDDLISFLNPLFGATGYGAEVTWLDAEVRAPLATRPTVTQLQGWTLAFLHETH
jgi:hypothetical protein